MPGRALFLSVVAAEPSTAGLLTGPPPAILPAPKNVSPAKSPDSMQPVAPRALTPLPPYLYLGSSLSESARREDEPVGPDQATPQRAPAAVSLAKPTDTLRGRSLTASQNPPRAWPRQDAHPTGNQVAFAEPALLRVVVRQSRLLRTSENVLRVVAEHDRVCDVVQFNAREIAVIGKQQGTARVDFWHDGQGRNRTSYLVVVDGEQNARAQWEEEQRKIEQLLAYLFPESRVVVLREPDQLIVRGHAVSQRQAVDILSTVRRSQSVPVVDEIAVQTAAK